MAGAAKLFDGHIIDRSNKEVDLCRKKYRGKIIGLYFSAHWYDFLFCFSSYIKFKLFFRCPPCRAFTPVLSELYAEFHKEKDIKIIFISSDKDEKSFHEYYEQMPWLALDFKDRKKKEELSKKYEVTTIPKLVLIDGDTGKLICSNAKEQILHLDPEGHNFPWRSLK